MQPQSITVNGGVDNIVLARCCSYKLHSYDSRKCKSSNWHTNLSGRSQKDIIEGNWELAMVWSSRASAPLQATTVGAAKSGMTGQLSSTSRRRLFATMVDTRQWWQFLDLYFLYVWTRGERPRLLVSCLARSWRRVDWATPHPYQRRRQGVVTRLLNTP